MWYSMHMIHIDLRISLITQGATPGQALYLRMLPVSRLCAAKESSGRLEGRTEGEKEGKKEEGGSFSTKLLPSSSPWLVSPGVLWPVPWNMLGGLLLSRSNPLRVLPGRGR